MSRSLGTLVALGTVLVVNAAFAFNNLAPYLGLNHVGAMTMFSGLTETADNHFVMPKVALGDADTYVAILRARPRGSTPAATDQFEAFADWAGGELVSLDLLRYQVSRVCASEHAARLELAFRTQAGRRLGFEDACAEPTMQRYALLSGVADCIATCPSIRELARGSARGE